MQFSDFSASNDKCNFKITKWDQLKYDNSRNRTGFVGNVKSVLDAKVYQTEELQTINSKSKKNCIIHAKSVFIVK